MRKEDKLTLCESLIGLGAFILIAGFAAGIVITAIGGNNWQLMKESPLIMMAFWIDMLIMWFGLILCIGAATAYNLNDKNRK